ncbi:hypothetical protein HDU96_010691 [Phlyctochytrium bullatum]|nr:hypothetical protein HDU96_010691 [Phlyctochytrium bullatum]
MTNSSQRFLHLQDSAVSLFDEWTGLAPADEHERLIVTSTLYNEFLVYRSSLERRGHPPYVSWLDYQLLLARSRQRNELEYILAREHFRLKYSEEQIGPRHPRSTATVSVAFQNISVNQAWEYLRRTDGDVPAPPLPHLAVFKILDKAYRDQYPEFDDLPLNQYWEWRMTSILKRIRFKADQLAFDSILCGRIRTLGEPKFDVVPAHRPLRGAHWRLWVKRYRRRWWIIYDRCEEKAFKLRSTRSVEFFYPEDYNQKIPQDSESIAAWRKKVLQLKKDQRAFTKAIRRYFPTPPSDPVDIGKIIAAQVAAGKNFKRMIPNPRLEGIDIDTRYGDDAKKPMQWPYPSSDHDLDLFEQPPPAPLLVQQQSSQSKCDRASSVKKAPSSTVQIPPKAISRLPTPEVKSAQACMSAAEPRKTGDQKPVRRIKSPKQDAGSPRSSGIPVAKPKLSARHSKIQPESEKTQFQFLNCNLPSDALETRTNPPSRQVLINC